MKKNIAGDGGGDWGGVFEGKALIFVVGGGSVFFFFLFSVVVVVVLLFYFVCFFILPCQDEQTNYRFSREAKSLQTHCTIFR